MKKRITIGIVVILGILLVGAGIYFLQLPKGNTIYKIEEFSFEAPAKFKVFEEISPAYIFKINRANVITVDSVYNMRMSCKGCEELRRFQYESDETNSNVTTSFIQINEYPAFLLEADTISDGDLYHMYQYYIFGQEGHLVVGGIFDKTGKDKYKKYVDAIAESVSDDAEEISYPDVYEDEDFYIALPEGFQAKRREQCLDINYIASDTYKRSFSMLAIEKLEVDEGGLEEKIQKEAERYQVEPYEGKLLDKYDAVCVHREKALELLTFESTQYFFEKEGNFYRVLISVPLQDEACEEAYLDILKTWK